MTKKQWLIFGLVLFALLLSMIGLLVLDRQKYLYSPFEFRYSKIVPFDRRDFEKPLRLEICYLPSDDADFECYYTTNEKEIKYFLSLFHDLDYINIKPLTHWRRTPKRYEVVLRKMTSEEGEYHLIDFFYNEGSDIGFTDIGEYPITDEIIDFMKEKLNHK